MDPRTAKRYAKSPEKPEYTLTGLKLDPYKGEDRSDAGRSAVFGGKDAVHRICNGYEHKYPHSVPSGCVSVLWGYPREILYDSMKQVAIKRLLKQEDSTLNRQFEDFAGVYGFEPILCRPYRGQTKRKVERTVQFVRDDSMVGIKYDNLADLNGQALAWCGKISGKGPRHHQ